MHDCLALHASLLNCSHVFLSCLFFCRMLNWFGNVTKSPQNTADCINKIISGVECLLATWSRVERLCPQKQAFGHTVECRYSAFREDTARPVWCAVYGAVGGDQRTGPAGETHRALLPTVRAARAPLTHTHPDPLTRPLSACGGGARHGRPRRSVGPREALRRGLRASRVAGGGGGRACTAATHPPRACVCVGVSGALLSPCGRRAVTRRRGPVCVAGGGRGMVSSRGCSRPLRRHRRRPDGVSAPGGAAPARRRPLRSPPLLLVKGRSVSAPCVCVGVVVYRRGRPR